ncbi:Trehalose utilization protein [Paenibacillus sp. UNC496MF]|uniref:ThuA domain-containing protein n=1 Tax=Paenibacillus sp. UNC496MF TaxID=1502753 RepID=UPI0008E67F9A|nr:ThuA domain-containing protein [Paenibacillus sp. UNC496MF]SFJ80951.1 Trehalose utilization protein [Paenibacillus sp. UNC496MF]
MSRTTALRVTVWNENRHERQNPRVREIYPDGIHSAIAGFLTEAGMAVRTATLDEPEHGLTDDALNGTDVLIWWGHLAHGEVRDDIVAKVQRRVLDGMGLIVLHSGHYSKIFRALMGTSCALKWREADEKERLWVVAPGHPIAAGIGEYIELEREGMYGEHFDIPAPDELVFASWFEGGEAFRSGCAYERGSGKVFYFRPGHETYPTYWHPDVQRVIANAANWARPVDRERPVYGNARPLEAIGAKTGKGGKAE